MTYGQLRELLLAMHERQLAMGAKVMADDGRTAEVEHLVTEDGESHRENARKQLFLCAEFGAK